tara:strand:+ start:681 stop:884 length:204 start_codon:yes stop_codon:yes gene_type:complete
MYQALVVACQIASMEICITFEDQNWFQTEKQCIARALEMGKDVHKHMKIYKAVSYRCRPLPKGELSR